MRPQVRPLQSEHHDLAPEPEQGTGSKQSSVFQMNSVSWFVFHWERKLFYCYYCYYCYYCWFNCVCCYCSYCYWCCFYCYWCCFYFDFCCSYFVLLLLLKNKDLLVDMVAYLRQSRRLHLCRQNYCTVVHKCELWSALHQQHCCSAQHHEMCAINQMYDQAIVWFVKKNSKFFF